MEPLVSALVASWLAGVASFLGGWIAHWERIPESTGKREFIHGVVAFGGGVLVAAIAYALTPDGIERLSPVVLGLTFLAGGVLFCVIDAWLSRAGGSRAQLLAMLMDFVPEAISLGAVFGYNRRLGLLLAAFIGVQNLPEGFNSFRERVASGGSRWGTLLYLLGASLLGPVSAALGWFLLQERPEITAGIMAFAAGGILYLIFQDIAPQARMRRHWVPPLGAVLGFLVGMICRQLLG